MACEIPLGRRELTLTKLAPPFPPENKHLSCRPLLTSPIAQAFRPEAFRRHNTQMPSSEIPRASAPNGAVRFSYRDFAPESLAVLFAATNGTVTVLSSRTSMAVCSGILTSLPFRAIT